MKSFSIQSSKNKRTKAPRPQSEILSALMIPSTKMSYSAERNSHNECHGLQAQRFSGCRLCAGKNLRVKSHACQPTPFFFYLLQSPTPPQYVFWYHNNRMINYDTTRGSVTVQTDPGPTQSRLTIRQAVETDTGNYTCSASNTKPASIFVFVTEGKYKQRVSYKANFLNQYNPVAVVPEVS